MAYKKHGWFKYGKYNVDKIEMTLYDRDNTKIDTFRCNNDEDYGRIICLIRDKYGYGKKVVPKTQLDIDKEVEEEKKWLDKHLLL